MSCPIYKRYVQSISKSLAKTPGKSYRKTDFHSWENMEIEYMQVGGFPRDGESLISEKFQILAEELCREEVVDYWVYMYGIIKGWPFGVTESAFAKERVASGKA